MNIGQLAARFVAQREKAREDARAERAEVIAGLALLTDERYGEGIPRRREQDPDDLRKLRISRPELAASYDERRKELEDLRNGGA